jgi:hypothetical protein
VCEVFSFILPQHFVDGKPTDENPDPVSADPNALSTTPRKKGATYLTSLPSPKELIKVKRHYKKYSQICL